MSSMSAGLHPGCLFGPDFVDRAEQSGHLLVASVRFSLTVSPHPDRGPIVPCLFLQPTALISDSPQMFLLSYLRRKESSERTLERIQLSSSSGRKRHRLPILA